jgi:hypothetical protein
MNQFEEQKKNMKKDKMGIFGKQNKDLMAPY